MSNQKISQLQNAAPLQDADLIPIVQQVGPSQVTNKTTISQLKQSIGSSGTGTGSEDCLPLDGSRKMTNCISFSNPPDGSIRGFWFLSENWIGERDQIIEINGGNGKGIKLMGNVRIDDYATFLDKATFNNDVEFKGSSQFEDTAEFNDSAEFKSDVMLLGPESSPSKVTITDGGRYLVSSDITVDELNCLKGITGPLKESISGIYYPGTSIKAIDATNNGLYVYDKAGNVVSTMDSNLFYINHNQANLDLYAQNPNQLSRFRLYENGLRFTREEQTNGVVTGAWQFRLDSSDGYFNSRNGIKIAAGTLSNDANDIVLDKLSGGTLRLLSGNKIDILSKGGIDIESGGTIGITAQNDIDLKKCKSLKITDLNGNTYRFGADAVGVTTKNITLNTSGLISLKNTNNGTTINTTYGLNNNTSSVGRDNITLNTMNNGLIVNQFSLSNSSNAATLKSPKVIFETDSFIVKDRSGNVVYDNSTIASLQYTISTLLTELNTLNARVVALESK